jgi:hypothetical protein
MLVADWKMRWLGISSHSTSKDWFGARGLSWHGFQCRYYLWNDEKEIAELHTAMAHQIAASDNHQDCGSVCSMYEALLWGLHLEFPDMKEIDVWQSDNASCYKHIFLYIFILEMQYNISSKL